MLIHRAAGRDYGLDTPYAQLVNAFGCEVIMYQEVISVKCRVIYFVLTEGDVTNHHIEVAVRQYSFFITTNLDIGFRIQLLGNAASYGVKFHAEQICAFVEAGRSVCEERTHTHARFQNVTALQAKALQSAVHCANDLRRRVIGGKCGRSGSLVFGLWKKLFQFLVFFMPVVFPCVKCVCQAAPAHISCEKLLLLRGGLHAGCLQVLEQTKGVDVVLEPGLWPARLCLLIRQSFVVLCVTGDICLIFLIGGLFGVCYRLEFRPFPIDRYFYSGLLWDGLRLNLLRGRRFFRLFGGFDAGSGWGL